LKLDPTATNGSINYGCYEGKDLTFVKKYKSKSYKDTTYTTIEA